MGDIPSYLASYLRDPSSPSFLLIQGREGAGKSLLLRELVARYEGPKLFVAYQRMPATDRSFAGSGDVSMLLVDPLWDEEGLPSVSGTPLAAGPAAGHEPDPAMSEAPRALSGAIERLTRRGGGAIFVDSWDRASETFFRAQASDPRATIRFTVPGSAIASLQSGIVSGRTHLVVALLPEVGGPLRSTADALAELSEEARGGGRLRVVAVPKSRGGRGPSASKQLYSLFDGRFRALPPLPKGFQVPFGPADPDPDPDAAGIWPGSRVYAEAFGRLRPSGFTGLVHSADLPDFLPQMLAMPMVAHVLRSGGRAVWLAAPTTRPSRLLGILREKVPDDWIRERLRIVSASGEDAGIAELKTSVLPLRREAQAGRDLRTTTSPGVGPLFPDAYRFLRDRPSSTPALYVLSIEGLRAATAVAGISLNAETFPVVIGSYARLPEFHGFGFGRLDDPLTVVARSAAETLIQVESYLGRPVLVGLRPETVPFALDWDSETGQYLFVTAG